MIRWKLALRAISMFYLFSTLSPQAMASTYTVTNTNDSGAGSLRQAILDANGHVGLDTIWFSIGSGLQTISPLSALPTITSPLVVDGTTQPGWTSAPIIELSGQNAGSGANGLKITAGNSIVRGLVINRFSNATFTAGIWISGTGQNTIQGNYIGTNAAGTDSAKNYQGIYISGGSGNLIGGSTASERNVISGNKWSAIRLDSGTTANVIRGNYIGLNANANAAVPNHIGVNIWTVPNNIVGGSGAGEGNIISGNLVMGLYLVEGGASGNVVQGNTVGLDKDRSVPIPNGESGIEICCAGNGGSNNIFGDTTGGGANVIAGNARAGIRIRGGEGNAILRNVIYSNGSIGINLGADTVTANHSTKTPGAPNLLMDFPVFTSATLSGTTLTLAGYVGSAPNQSDFGNARVEIFKSDNDASGYGEGPAFLGSLTTDANGNFTGAITVGGLSVGDKVTGTATDTGKNTSEFGGNFTVTDGLPIQLSSFTAQVLSSGNLVSLRWMTLTETNNYGFEVQRKGSGDADFAGVLNGFVPGHGTTLQPQHYSYTDASVTSGKWSYRLKQIDLDGTVHYTDPVQVGVSTDVKEESLPTAFALKQNYPNPFNPSTVVSYQLPVVSGQPSVANLKVYDLLGREVAVMVNERQAPGSYSVRFNASGLASGVYLYRLTAGSFSETKRLTLVK